MSCCLKPKVSTRIICQIALLIAITFVLERQFAVLNLADIRVSFSFIPMMICGMLFGPVWGAVSYGIADILGWTMMAGAPIPLILVSRIINGFIFGLVLHRENLKFWPHAFINSFLAQIICAAGITTLALSLTFGRPFFAQLVLRLPAIAIIFVLQIVFVPLLIKLRDALRKSGVSLE